MTDSSRNTPRSTAQGAQTPAAPRAEARPADPKPVPAELRGGDDRITITALVGSGAPDGRFPTR